MRRTTFVAIAALMASLVAGATVGHATEPGATTFYLHWDAGCSGTTGVDESGIMNFTSRPSEDPCVLFFPGITPSAYVFTAEEGVPFRLDATSPVRVRFVLNTIAHAAVRLDFSVSGTIENTKKRIAGGSTSIVAAALLPTTVDVSLPTDPALDGAQVEGLTFTIAQPEGVSWSTMSLESDSAWIEVTAQDQPALDG